MDRLEKIGSKERLLSEISSQAISKITPQGVSKLGRIHRDRVICNWLRKPKELEPS